MSICFNKELLLGTIQISLSSGLAGLLYTYRDGRRVDTTHLHIAEWIECIREGRQPSCDIDQAFEEGNEALGT